ncbi:MAG: SDR family NAD(P)-dependent oxidoreductase [Hyphomicrobiaceae bacterium]
MGKLDGKVALITGSGRGMGKSHALLMAQEGANVIIQDIDGALVEEAAAEVRKKGGKVATIVCDVSDVKVFPGAIAAASQAMGKIDILVNNAGIDTPGTIEEITSEAWQRMFDVHVKGAFLAAKAVVPGMKERRAGKIVNVSSIWGMVGHNSHSHYCGAKAALLGLTKAWAKELAPWNIMVNAIAPGLVTTEMVLKKGGMDYIRQAAEKVPLKRSADCIEMSYTVLFLSCHESDFITGQVISPNGGDTIVGI